MSLWQGAPKSAHLPAVNLERESTLVGDGTEQTWNPVPETWKETAEMVGRLITATFFLALCVGTIALYQRRREMNTVSTVSQRIFELACAGLAAGIFTLCYILRVPIFDQPIPE